MSPVIGVIFGNRSDRERNPACVGGLVFNFLETCASRVCESQTNYSIAYYSSSRSLVILYLTPDRTERGLEKNSAYSHTNMSTNNTHDAEPS